MDTTIQLFTYVDGVNDIPFPSNADEPITIGAFRYDAKRMGGAPTITASVNYPSCLDNEWTDNVYAEFNGEKYYLKQTPTSSYNNESTMYKHDLVLVSERVILDDVYFYDAVVSSEMETEPVMGNPTQSSEWQLFGNIDIDKEYTTFFARLENGSALGRFDVVFDEAIRIVGGPPIDMKIESATGNIYVYDNYGYLAQLGLHLVFSYIEYEKGKPVSNGTNVTFFGNIREFAKRLQASLIKCGVGYSVVVDEDVITTEEKLMSFEDQFFSNVLQEIYNTYEVPYYFEGKTIHIGWAKEGEVLPTFAYGANDALLSITKNNANYKIVNRATGTGSSDNIPFYYPNNSPKGEIAATSSNANLEVTILDAELYSNEVKLNGIITRSNIDHENLEVTHLGESIYSGETFSAQMGNGGTSKDFVVTFDAKDVGELSVSFESQVTKFILNETEINDATFGVRYYMSLRTPSEDGYPFGREVFTSGGLDSIEDVRVPIVKALNGYKLKITASYAATGKYAGKGGSIVYDASFDFGSESGWTYDGRPIELKDVGLKVEGTPSVGDTITQELVSYIKTSPNLMPYKYRVTMGEERFYNAYNRFYEAEEGGTVHFNNPYVEGHPKEHIITVEDIRPTIKETEVNGLRIDMFSEFAYDEGDNDETYEDEEGNVYFKHPYFYGKLRVMDFNLFDHAIENQPMTISFTSGDCGACNFEIGVTEEYPQKNPVQVYEEDIAIDGILHKAGSLKRDENGMVLAGIEGTQQDVTEFQDRQQDTSKYEVWIALKKEEETYGILMPQGLHKPKAAKNEDGTLNNEGDTFVILGINLPKSYIINAEKKLEAEIIKYLKDNNDEKFTFSIAFSRIYFEENDNVLKNLNENSRIKISYNGGEYDLYVSSFSYSMSEGDVLPEIRVELDDTLKVSQNALQNAISQVKSELGRAIGNIDVVGAATPYFIRKDADDEVQGKINFKKGIKFGEGGEVEIFDNNSAKLTIEYLEVTKKASFTSLEIKEKTHVGGQIVISPAAMTCGEVEEFDDYYRCYFQIKGADGNDEIFNQFVEGDLAICQTYNAWGSRYYWRLVVGVGEDYIDLSKVEGDYDENSVAPMAGDKIVQLGNRGDKARQAAQVLSAYGEDSPSFIMYNGINSFSLEGKNITGIIWNPETQEPQMYSYGSFFFGDRMLDGNYITFQKPEGKDEKELYISANVSLGSDSTGLSNLEEFKSLDEEVKNIQGAVGDFEYLADTLGKSADVEGAVLAQTLAVKDGDGNISAMLNGSTIGEDEACGKLMMAGGIPAASSSGSATLSERAKEATTRIYEDGCVYTKNMHLEEGCTVGGFSITEYAIGVDGCDTVGDGHGVSMSKSGFIARGTKNTGSSCTIERDVTISASNDAFGLVEAKTKSDTDNAFYIRQGVFAGLRPNLRRIGNSGTSASPHVLDEYDHTILVDFSTSGSTVYLRLPATPMHGQRYEIITTDQDIDLSINTNSKTVTDCNTGNINTSGTLSFTAAYRRHITLIYDSTYLYNGTYGRWYMFYRNLTA